jgi:hypothetical protein
MNRKNTKTLFSVLLILFLIVVAILCRQITRNGLHNAMPFADKMANNIRTFIYLGLFSVWGVSVNRRVLQISVRRILVAVSVLMVFWIVVREFKFRYVLDPVLLRYLWYVYYIPLLIIPLLALFVSFKLGKTDDCKNPEWLKLFFIPTFALICLVLTNDFHQFAFDFPDNRSMWTEQTYRYGWLFYAATGWVYICCISAFVTMATKLRIPRSKKFLWLPLLPFAIGVVYGILYALRIPIISSLFGDLSIVFSLSFTAFFESCIQCGLIQSNSRYSEIFAACVGTPIQIVDNSFTPFYSTNGSERFTGDEIRRAEKTPLIISGGRRLHAISIDGGYAVWTEDISQLLSLREEFEERSEELRERNMLLQHEYEQEREHKTVEEQNRLYDLLQKITQGQLNSIDELVLMYKSVNSAAAKKRLLARIVVLGTYIKRRKDFVLSMQYAEYFPESMLASALAESFRALKLLDINGGFLVDTGRESVPAVLLARVYDFFEAVTETVLDSAEYINASFTEINGVLRISITTDCTADTDKLFSQFPEMRTEHDDGMQFILLLEGGEGGA